MRSPCLRQTGRIKQELDSGDATPDIIGKTKDDFSTDADMLVSPLTRTQLQEGGVVPNQSTISTTPCSKTRKRVDVESVYVSGFKVENFLLLKAQEVRDSLPENLPTMIKAMLPSSVYSGLRLERGFGAMHLPGDDTMIDLEDEDGLIHSAKYLVRKNGLSGGWKAFCIHHKLVPGDVLVFQLVEPTKFKVYIVRERKSDEIDVDLGLPQMDSDKAELKSENLSKGYKESNNNLLSNNKSERQESDDGFGFSISDGIRMSESTSIDFEQVKSFDDFDIVVNGLVINCELSRNLQVKYYELCSSQKLFLHQHILSGLNCKLIAGVIAETVNIADAVRAAGDNTQQKKDEFATWENTLVAFEKLGMNVEFILTRLRQLMSLCDDANRHKRLRTERFQVEEEVKILKSKLDESVERIKRIDGEMEVDHEVKLRELAEAPW
ncbi:B3 domain-containing protein Os01g0234100 [Linum grandiflorum]